MMPAVFFCELFHIFWGICDMAKSHNQIPHRQQIQIKRIHHAHHRRTDGGHWHSTCDAPWNQGSDYNNRILKGSGQVFLVRVEVIAHLAGENRGQALVAAHSAGQCGGQHHGAEDGEDFC